MSRRPAPLPPRLPAAFSVRDAQAAGVTLRRLRARDLDAPFWGVRRRAGREDDDRDDELSPVAREGNRLRRKVVQQTAAYAARAAGGILFTHATAAVVWDLPVPLRLLRQASEAIDVAVLDTRRAPKGAGVRGHQLRAQLTDVREHCGLAVASPACVWAQLAPALSVDELIELGDAVVHVPRRRGMQRGGASDARGTVDELEDAARAGRRLGAAKLRAALPLIRVGAASPPETRIRLACLRAGLPAPELDVDVFAVDGRAIGYTELAFPAHRVLVEYEGDHHRRDRTQWHRDIHKHAACAAAGWEVVRLTAADLHREAAPAVARIADALRRGAERSRSSVPFGRRDCAQATEGDG